VPHAATLNPGDAHTVSLPERAWSEFYKPGATGGRPRDSKAEDAATIIERRGAAAVVEHLTPDQRREVVEEVAKVQPETVTEVAGSTFEAAAERVSTANAANRAAFAGPAEDYDRAVNAAKVFMERNPGRAQAFADEVMLAAREIAEASGANGLRVIR
jgi:hypothetical protein